MAFSRADLIVPTVAAYGHVMPASMAAQGIHDLVVEKHLGFVELSHKARPLDEKRGVHYVIPIHSLHSHVHKNFHILDGFSRRILRKPEDSLANKARRLSISCNRTRACIVLLAFGTSLPCSASS